MTAANLRGVALREHLRKLSVQYSWRELVGREVDSPPQTVTKRKKAPRSAIWQTPVRQIQLHEQEPVSAHQSPATVIKPSSANFLAGLESGSDEDEDEEAEGDGEDDGEDDEEMRRLSSSFARSVGVLEHVPAPRPTKVRSQEAPANSSAPPAAAAATMKAVAASKTGAKGKGKGKAAFAKEREELVRSMFLEFNAGAFRSCLPADLSIKWNKRLLTTAGITKLRLSGETRLASVELSEKVLDDVDRLKTTLLHELCHAAAWIADGERRPPHGPSFWRWAKIVSNAVPNVNITTCHSYLVHKPFRFKCTNLHCGVEYSRHSKSIDTESHRCGACRGVIAYQGKFDANGTPGRATARAAGGFSLYVKEHFAATKERMQRASPPSSPSGRKSPKRKLTHGDVMQQLARMYKEGRDGKAAVIVLGDSPLATASKENAVNTTSRSNPIVL